MSWKDRLKRSLRGDEAGAPVDARRAVSEPVVAVVRPPAPGGAKDHASLVDELRARLVEYSDGKLRAYEIDAHGHLFDYGYIDSLSAVSFIALVEEEYGARIEDVELLDQLSTLDAIAARIRNSG
jgi:acyl carrier protein